MSNKIYYFSDYFYPESNAPAHRIKYNANYLYEKGFNIEVVTCNPNFPFGKLYKGYKNNIIYKDTSFNYNVTRLWSFIYPNKGLFLRVLDHFSSMLMFFIYSLRIKKNDVVVATSPQFLTILSLFFSSYIKNFKFIVEIRDMWPEGIIFLKKNTFTYKFLEFIEGRIYKRASSIIVVTNSFKNSIHERFNINKDKIFVSYNGSDFSKYYNKSNKNFNFKENNNLVIGYAGTVGISHNVDKVCEYINNYNNNFLNKLKLKLVIAGSGSMYDNFSSVYSSDNIDFIGFLDHELIPNFYDSVDVSLITLKNIPQYEKVIPSKLFECLVFQKPLLGGIIGEAKSIVQDNNFGVCFHDNQSFSDGINMIIKNYSFYKNNIINKSSVYDRNNCAAVFESAVKSVL